jgi:pimeloyl-ACP methyl ester carboxylesterase
MMTHHPTALWGSSLSPRRASLAGVTDCSAGRTAGIPVVLFLPGLGLDRRSWARVRRRVGGEVVLLPGMGLRAPVGDLAALTGQLLARLGPGPVVLVAHSQSCHVAVAAAADRRVAGLVLCGPTTDPRLLRRGRLAARWARTAAVEPWWQVPLLLAQWLTTGPRRMVALWRRTSRGRTDLGLREVGVPVVVVRGSRDALCPRDWAQQVAQLAPHGRLVELPGAAHMTPQTRPDDVARVVRELLGELAAQPGPAEARR